MFLALAFGGAAPTWGLPAANSLKRRSQARPASGEDVDGKRAVGEHCLAFRGPLCLLSPSLVSPHLPSSLRCRERGWAGAQLGILRLRVEIVPGAPEPKLGLRFSRHSTCPPVHSACSERLVWGGDGFRAFLLSCRLKILHHESEFPQS